MAITIHDVAREAGVSISTVSKVIHGSSRISQVTKDRVRAVMDQLDFQPNSIARAFVLQSSGAIGVLTDMKRGTVAFTPHVYEVLTGIESALLDAGYILSLFHVDSPEAIRDRVDGMNRAKRIDGFILHTTWLTDPVIAWLEQSGIPYVEIGTDCRVGKEKTVDVDNVLAGELAADHLLDIGCRRPVFLSGGADDTISLRRYEGIRAAFSKRGFTPRGEHYYPGSESPERSFETMKRLLSLPEDERPDGVICTGNFTAQGAMKAARSMGVRIPDEVAFVGFDNFPLAPYLDPPLTVVQLDMFSLGIEAARTVIRRLGRKGGRPDAPPLPAESALMPPSLIVRESSVKAPRS